MSLAENSSRIGEEMETSGKPTDEPVTLLLKLDDFSDLFVHE